MEGSEIRPEFNTISCELKALAKMAGQEFSSNNTEWSSLSANRSPLFERGRFYDEYCARRNERLRRKKGETGGGWEGKGSTAAGNDYLGVRIESAKRRDTTKTKRFDSLRKTVPCTPLKDRVQVQATPAPLPPPSSSRYLLRSSICKENKKPASAGIGEKKIGVRRGRRI